MIMCLVGLSEGGEIPSLKLRGSAPVASLREVKTLSRLLDEELKNTDAQDI